MGGKMIQNSLPLAYAEQQLMELKVITRIAFAYFS